MGVRRKGRELALKVLYRIDLTGEEWVQEAVQEMGALTDDGRVTLVRNYGRALMDPIPLEPVGAASRFLSYQWLHILQTLGVTHPGADAAASTG